MRLGFPSVPDRAALLSLLLAAVWGKTRHGRVAGTQKAPCVSSLPGCLDRRTLAVWPKTSDAAPAPVFHTKDTRPVAMQHIVLNEVLPSEGTCTLLLRVNCDLITVQDKLEEEYCTMYCTVYCVENGLHQTRIWFWSSLTHQTDFSGSKMNFRRIKGGNK